MRLEDIDQIDSVVLSSGDALIVVDMQNDFMPGGTLQVEKGDAIISGVNSAMQLFNHKDLCVVMTQDWHPILHDSFASAHEGKLPFDPIEAPGIGPILWPDHCIQSTQGADFHKDIMTDLAQAVIRKGYHKSMDSYSGFLENDKKTTTGLDGYLKSKSIQRIFVCGLALDYCVFFTSADGIALGYEVFVLADLSMPVGSPENSIVYALTTMQNRGVRFALSSALK